MKVIIAGSRSFNDYELLKTEVGKIIAGVVGVEIVSGGARGADKLGEKYAKEKNIRLAKFPAKWNEHGRAAGIIRNRDMADYADVLLAFWDGESKGTKAMIEFMQKQRKPTKVVLFQKP